MKNPIKNVISKLSRLILSYTDIYQLNIEINRLKVENAQFKTWVPPGHFYSPIPLIEDIKLKEDEIWNNFHNEIPGIDLNVDVQIDMINIFKEYYKELPFDIHKKENLRYYFENSNYSYSDAIFLYCMIRYTKPKKIIEVGSGYSSCVILDTNELFFNDAISCSFIEPYPQLLLSLIKDRDKNKIELIQNNLQDVDINKFSELSKGDILFIDSTHVSKINSDVNFIFFDILPRIKSGVYIHFHDIFYPFEYPKEWIYEGRSWNEDYLLRAFLQYNDIFKIQFFNTFLEHFYKDEFINDMPLCLKNPGGSIWIKKI